MIGEVEKVRQRRAGMLELCSRKNRRAGPEKKHSQNCCRSQAVGAASNVKAIRQATDLRTLWHSPVSPPPPETNYLLFSRLANILWSSPSNLMDQPADALPNEQTNRKALCMKKGLNNL